MSAPAAAALIFAASLAGQAPSAAPPSVTPDTDAARIEGRVLELSNDFRRKNGLSALRADPALTAAARAFAAYLARTGRFAHDADGGGPGERAEAAGYAYCEVAENLSTETSVLALTPERRAQDAMQGWTTSPGHRRNLLLARAADTGVGASSSAGATPGSPQVVVQLFGQPRSTRYSFQVLNDSDWRVSYAMGPTVFRSEPHTRTTHTSCDPKTIVFNLGGDALPRRQAQAGAVYRVAPDAAGALTLEVRADGAAPPP